MCVCVCVFPALSATIRRKIGCFFFAPSLSSHYVVFPPYSLYYFFLNHSNSYVIEHYRSTNREPIIVSTFNLRWWLTIGGGSKAVGGKNPLDSHTSYLFSERTRSKYEHLISISVRNIKTLDLKVALQQLVCFTTVSVMKPLSTATHPQLTRESEDRKPLTKTTCHWKHLVHGGVVKVLRAKVSLESGRHWSCRVKNRLQNHMFSSPGVWEQREIISVKENMSSLCKKVSQ